MHKLGRTRRLYAAVLLFALLQVAAGVRPYELRQLEDDDCDEFMSSWEPSEKCDWAQRCTHGKSFIPYGVLAFCHVPKPPLILLFYLPWAILLFYLGGTVADNYLTPPMIRLAKILRISDSLAGCTILAMANATSDLQGGVSLAWSNPDALDLFVGDIFGASLFLTTVVVGSVIFVSRSKVVELNRDSCLRDSPFFAAGLIVFLCLNFVTHIPTWACIPLFGAYVLYVWTAWYQMRRTPVNPKAIREYCELFHTPPPPDEENGEKTRAAALPEGEHASPQPGGPKTGAEKDVQQPESSPAEHAMQLPDSTPIVVAIHEPPPVPIDDPTESKVPRRLTMSAATAVSVGDPKGSTLDVPTGRGRRTCSADEKRSCSPFLVLPRSGGGSDGGGCRSRGRSRASLGSFIALAPGSRFVESSFVADVSNRNPSLVALSTRPGKLLISQREAAEEAEKGAVVPTAVQSVDYPGPSVSAVDTALQAEEKRRERPSCQRVILWPLYAVWNLTIPRVDPEFGTGSQPTPFRSRRLCAFIFGLGSLFSSRLL